MKPLLTRDVLVSAVLAVSCLCPTALRAQFDARGPRVVSPEVTADGITFRLLAPQAAAVRLSGSDIPAAAQGVDLVKGSDNIWSVTLNAPPGYYRYTFQVDGVPVVDPRNPATSQSNTNVWSLVGVPGAAWMDTQEVPHGAVAQVTYHSSALGRFRRLHVYTPPGYETGEGRFPVLYLLHGASDSDNSWATVGRAGFILDNLIAQQTARPMIVVMPAGHTGEFRFGGPRPAADEFEQDFLQDIMPLIETRYRVVADRAHRALAGLSMGGAQTLNIGIGHLDKFAYLGVFSSGVFGITGRGPGGMAPPGPTFEERHGAILDDEALKDGLKLCWFATGRDDFLIETSRATVDMLNRHGFQVDYHETDGGHTWIVWREYLRDFAGQLFQ